MGSFIVLWSYNINKKPDDQAHYNKLLGAQIDRKLKSQNKKDNIWFGFGVFELVGWSIALPSVLGVLLGVLLDKKYPSHHSWTLILLIAGLCIGCWNAARWMIKEHKEIQDKESGETDD